VTFHDEHIVIDKPDAIKFTRSAANSFDLA
jgi:hypothetical protein